MQLGVTPDLLYENGKIRITKNVFSNGEGEQFVIANIRGIRDEHKGKAIGLLILAVIMFGVSSFVHPFPYSTYAMNGVGGLLLLWYITQKERWVLLLTTPQGEVAAFTTKDPIVYRDVSGSLKRAISAHSSGQ